MKGDFSRYTFDPKKHYTQVLMQQGRVVTDADWNEQQAISQHRIATATQDIIGPCGVPEGSNGFQVGNLNRRLHGVQFIDQSQGWIVGDGGLLLTTANRGRQWVSRSPGSSQLSTYYLVGVHFINTQQGWVLATGPTDSIIYATQDGGYTWQKQFSSQKILDDVVFTSEQRGWVIGFDDYNNVLLATINGGHTWTVQNIPDSGALWRIHFISDQQGWIITRDGEVLRTVNGGQSWTVQQVEEGLRLLDLYFINGEQGWIIGYRSDDRDIVLRTDNGGTRWTEQSIFEVGTRLFQVFFLTPELGWICGVRNQNGLILATRDGGNTWEVQSNSSRGLFRDIVFVDEQYGWAVGDQGTVLTTDNGGETWEPSLQPTELTLSPGRIYVDGILCETEGHLFSQQPDYPQAKLPEESGLYLIYLDVWQRHLTHLDDPRIREVALGGPDTTSRLKTICQVKFLSVSAQEVDSTPTCNSSFAAWDRLTAPVTGTLNARTNPVEAVDSPCLIPASAGYQRLENQLYRIEVHQGGELGEATFKWSRDNGSVVTQIVNVDGQNVTVTDLGKDAILGFANGQWVEVIDNVHDLNGQPGQLAQIIEINPATQVITLSSVPSGIDLAQSPKLRRWDSEGDILVETPTEKAGWIQLEGGIEVKFSPGTYRTGNYWLIPARMATGEIEWPPYEVPNINPTPQRPLGIQHHYCRLALIVITRDGQDRLTAVQDCRRFFPPLTHPLAMHVTAISWQNDSAMALDNFINRGLRIELDTTPEPRSINRATLVVTIEVPSPYLSAQGPLPTSETSPDGVFILDGTISLRKKTIVWKPLEQQILRIIEVTEKAFSDENVPNRYLIRVLLKGHKVWSASPQPRLYLDGQVFGQPAAQDAVNGIISLIFPSGDNQRASDFDSWFYLAKPIELVSLNIDFPKSVRAEGTIRATVTLSGLAPAEGVVISLRRTVPVTGTPVTIPATVTVPANAHSTSFVIRARSVGEDTQVTIEASLRENSEQDELTVIALPRLLELTVIPDEVYGGIEEVTGRVVLSKGAPPGGALINLRSSNLLARFERPTVIVPAGAAQANFKILTPINNPPSFPQGGTAEIFASYGGETKQQNLIVNYPI